MLHTSSSESEAGAPLSWRPDPLSAMLVNRGLPPRGLLQKSHFALFQLGIFALESNNYWIQSRKMRVSSENQVFAKMLKIQLQLPYIPL